MAIAGSTLGTTLGTTLGAYLMDETCLFMMAKDHVPSCTGIYCSPVLQCQYTWMIN